jgi:hypothetical protein
VQTARKNFRCERACSRLLTTVELKE